MNYKQLAALGIGTAVFVGGVSIWAFLVSPYSHYQFATTVFAVFVSGVLFGTVIQYRFTMYWRDLCCWWEKEALECKNQSRE